MSEKDRLDIMDIGLGKLEKEIAELRDKLNSRLIATIDDPRIEKLEQDFNKFGIVHFDRMVAIYVGKTREHDIEISGLKKQLENIHKSVLFNNSEIFDIGSVLKDFIQAFVYEYNSGFNSHATAKYYLKFIEKLSGEKERVISGSFDQSHVEPNKIPLEDEVQSHQHSKPESQKVCPNCRTILLSIEDDFQVWLKCSKCEEFFAPSDPRIIEDKKPESNKEWGTFLSNGSWHRAGSKPESKSTHALDALLHATAPIPLHEVHKLIQDAKKELIAEFLEKLKMIGVYHTKDGLIKEYEARLKDE